MKHLSQMPEPPSELRAEVPHDLDAVVMRALAKDPDQRYGSAEEMDADLARVARGVAVSRETEDAMTQVLSGAGIATAQRRWCSARARSRRRRRRPPTARRATTTTRSRRGGRSIWPWLLALGLIIAGAVGGWFLYTKIQDQLNSNKPIAVPDVDAAARVRSPSQKLKQRGPEPARRQGRRATPCRRARCPTRTRAAARRSGKGSTVTLTVSTGKPKVKVPNVVGHDVDRAPSRTLAGSSASTRRSRASTRTRSRTP